MIGRPVGSGVIPPEVRFWSKVDKTETCWLWTASIRNQGYGVFWPQWRTNVPAHRWAYEQIIGPVPDGLELDHLCRVRNCVNPAHLEPVTHRENMLRGHTFAAANARKSECINGHELSGDNLMPTRANERRCRQCDRERQAAWRANNRERFNERAREYRAKRKATS